MNKQTSVRLSATNIVTRVINGESLNTALPKQQELFSDRDQALLAELSYGTIRYYIKLKTWLEFLMDKPLKAKDNKIHSLLLIGIYQLFHTRIPAHAAINETVKTTQHLHRSWAKNLVNGVLRNAQRNHNKLREIEKTNQDCATSHPDWLVKELKSAWPNYWQQIISANNEQPPMSIRVNKNIISRDEYLKKLHNTSIKASKSYISPQCLTLNKPLPVTKIPFFSEGYLSIQDESAQLAGTLIPIKNDDRVLDACCAPGGKTCHILEQYPDITLHALDSDENRLIRVKENLDRLGLKASIICGDAKEPKKWWDGKSYNCIILDAPCSATGVIRRHPDIKLLRKPFDITALAQLQRKILNQIWPLLKPGGTLLYITCSVMPQENHQQIERFIMENSRYASLQKIQSTWGYDTGYGKQILPNIGDGFFYSLIRKTIVN